MSDSESHPIRNGVIITVIGGLILAFLIFFVPRAATFIWAQIVALWNFLISGVTISWEILLLLIVLSLPTLWNFLKLIFRRFKVGKDDEPKEPSLDSYVEDVIYGVRCKWSRILRDGFPDTSLWGYCDNCKTKLVYKEESYPDKTIFYCETCKKDVLTLDGEFRFALSQIARQIQRRVNTGEWKEAVALSQRQNKNNY